MHRVVGLLLAILLAGCMQPGYLATAHFDSPGAYRAALEAGAKVRDPKPALDGTGIALSAPDLDERWGKDSYLLTKLRWGTWIPGGPTANNPQQQWDLVSFELDARGLMVESHDSTREEIRTPTLHFLENATTLSPAAQQEVLARVLNATGPVELPPQALDASKVWVRVGGLQGLRVLIADPDQYGTGYQFVGYLPYPPSVGSGWSFMFTHGWATLETGWGSGSTQTHVTPLDRVHFTWSTDTLRTDDAADAKLASALDGTGIQVPGNVTWGHQRAEH